MSLRAARARRIATATAFGGGGLTLLGAGTIALLYLQAKLAHRTVGFTEWTPPRVNGVYGSGDGTPISLVMMGDSTAAGFALTDGLQTPGSLIASGLSAVAERPVRMRNVAAVGATSAGLYEQLEQVRSTRPDLAIVFIGANDVIHRMRPADSVRHLQSVVRELTSMGTAVVVGTCPDLGSVRPIGLPLRLVARRSSRQLAAAQTIAVVEEGGRTVSLSNMLADEFQAYPDELFGPDRFHPSARGYAQAAIAVLPTACVALGLLPDLETVPDPDQGEGVLPISRAAVEAAEEPGMEVSGVKVAGHERGPRGRWATLLRRRTETPVPDIEGEATAERAEVEREADEARGAPVEGGG
ncbi:G-D-S-L family lipolytic protein [Nocardiopsis gilva YIM 90087]|uniref:G-D-S-L family lipolytic protein n=1 Tax=Nocardiopsis gilva YIM 90087 TaxID=1235441 RepID=A0A223S2Z5_9ACTN|nr:SGNH/GDSL hydrolase family protein [Nocardiopsis gilva]ASU82494.1 G-D-S-L family lipolytic protein [Nocardiopsis gilva YIM 90087]